MTNYLIRPNSKGFGVYRGRNWLGRPKLVQQHERLFTAELHALNLVTQDYHRMLDHRLLTHQTMSTDMLEPRKNEEHVYMALLMAGKRPASGDGSYDDVSGFSPRHAAKNPEEYEKYDNILKTQLGDPISHTARVMFEERYMTWYGQQNPKWVDPRRERDYDVQRDMVGGNRYRNQASEAMSAGYGPTNKVKGWLATMKFRKDAIWNALFGPTAKQVEAAAQAMEQAGGSPGR